jgi:hypothetical protein
MFAGDEGTSRRVFAAKLPRVAIATLAASQPRGRMRGSADRLVGLVRGCATTF